MLQLFEWDALSALNLAPTMRDGINVARLWLFFDLP